MRLTTLRLRLSAGVFLLLALVVVLGGIVTLRIREMSGALDTVYKDRIVCLEQLRVVQEAYTLLIVNAAVQSAGGSLPTATALARIHNAQRDAAAQWKNYKTTYLTPQEARLAAAAEAAMHDADAAVVGLHRRLSAPSVANAAAQESTLLGDAFQPLSAALDRLRVLQSMVTRQEVDRGMSAYNHAVRLILLMVAAVAVLGAVLVWRFLVAYALEENAHASRLKRLNNFYLALSQTNQLIVRERDETRLFNEICRICVEHGHSLLASVFVTDGQKATRVASVGPASEMFAGLPLTFDLHEGATRRSVAATAMLEGKHAISQDYQHEAPAALWRDLAAKAGVGSVASFPLCKGGKPVGALSLYATETNFFEEPLVQLLDEMAGDVSFALDNIERDAARAREQEATAESLGNFRAAFQGSPVSTVIADLATGIIYEANDTFCERYRVSREEMVGHTMSELGFGLLPPDRDRYFALVQSEGRVRNLEVRSQLRNGDIATLLANSEPIQYKGRPCMLSMTMNVTDLHQAAAAREAQFEAEAANRAKTEFLSRMSHELRTPLNAMLGFAQLLRADAAERLTVRENIQLEHIHRAGWHLLALVNDVLDVARIESGTFNILTRDMSLRPLLAEVVQIAEPLAEQSGVSLESDHKDLAELAVNADPLRLRQVFINLLSNAIKYNRPGGSVRVRVHAEEHQVTVAVVDTGLGMTNEQLKHLYEPFNRLGRERGGVEGTGLGLSLTRELARKMGGQLEIESKAGQGTTAKVVLPRVEALEPDSAESPSQSAFGALEPSGVVLYIEDNEVNVLVVEQMLARWSGVRFIHAPDGETGVEQARWLRPDLVLLDMQLPDMHGFDVLRDLAQREETAHLYVVVLSASAMADDVEAAKSAGAKDYWTKPLEFQSFLRNVAAVLSTVRRA